MEKTAKISTVITTTNTDPNLAQQFILAANLQPSNHLMLFRSENTSTTKFNLLIADNLAQLSDSTTNSYQDLLIDTYLNATIESLPKKFYTTALIGNQKSKPSQKVLDHQDLY
ncbi:18615_t:CDS:1 [Dentiscutata erythropus]|uniref:18615_t:CDS:1 n=1 Tax=Dentiscutata erythropus TaxID=1348616 RepID=A0A9N9GFR6_9GLOM|nr:18615_t:CDS:1 [Dentiscutata erythropus]